MAKKVADAGTSSQDEETMNELLGTEASTEGQQSWEQWTASVDERFANLEKQESADAVRQDMNRLREEFEALKERVGTMFGNNTAATSRTSGGETEKRLKAIEQAMGIGTDPGGKIKGVTDKVDEAAVSE